MELQKKVNRRICVRDIRFSAADPPSYVTFIAFSFYSRHSRVIHLLNGPYKGAD